MADPLSLLRQYSMQRKQIIERDNNIMFGEFSWPKTVKTNYIIYGKWSIVYGKKLAKVFLDLFCYVLYHTYLTIFVSKDPVPAPEEHFM